MRGLASCKNGRKCATWRVFPVDILAAVQMHSIVLIHRGSALNCLPLTPQSRRSSPRAILKTTHTTSTLQHDMLVTPDDKPSEWLTDKKLPDEVRTHHDPTHINPTPCPSASPILLPVHRPQQQRKYQHPAPTPLQNQTHQLPHALEQR